MNTTLNNEILVNNSSQTQQTNEFNLFNDWQLTTSNESIGRGKIPFKKRILNSIDNEISIINEREDLKLRKINKTIKGKIVEQNESRFWKQSIEEPNSLLVSVKVKGKIVKFNSNDEIQYAKCNASKESLIELLNNIKSNVEQLENNHPIFNQ